MNLRFLPLLLLPVFLIGCNAQLQRRKVSFFWSTLGIPKGAPGVCEPIDYGKVPPSIVVKIFEWNEKEEEAFPAGSLSNQTEGDVGIITEQKSEGEFVECTMEYIGDIVFQNKPDNLYHFFNGRDDSRMMFKTEKEIVEFNYILKY